MQAAGFISLIFIVWIVFKKDQFANVVGGEETYFWAKTPGCNKDHILWEH